MEMAIVTGASKGLGKEISNALIESNIEVVGLSRNINDIKNDSKGLYSHHIIDLTNINEIEAIITRLCQQMIAHQPKKVYVINNASMIEPIERLGNLENHLIEKAVQLNYLAPMYINNLLMEEIGGGNIDLVIVNVTSGAAERPIHGWSIYNSTKAAINMHTKVAGFEQENSGGHHKIIGFNPGIMDTTMQSTIRGSKKDAFAEIDKFLNYKESGKLRHPKIVGKALINMILNEHLSNGKIYTIEEIL
jgi:benzil reductase ((S)-benzoin forming)